MRTLKEAQEALAEFDREHWKHEPGARTAYHTSLHLVKAVFSVTSKIILVRSNSLSLRQFLRLVMHRLSGVFIEHAIRLSRAGNRDLTQVLISAARSATTIGEWLEHCQEESHELSSDGHFLELTEKLGLLLHLCERTDHGETVGWEQAVSAVPTLMKCSAICGPTDHPCTSIEEFLGPFTQRLQELSRRFGYARG